MEQNKTGKYLKYAFGEIILVVIGILIALSINNWNQERLEKNRFQSNLLYMLEDIEQNQNELDELKIIRRKAVIASTNIIDRFRLSQLIPDEVWNDAFFEIVIERQFRGNFNGFEKSKSSVIYESELFANARILVSDYDELIKQLNYSESKLNITIEEIERELFQNGFQDEIWDYVRVEFIDSIKYEKPELNLDFLEVIKTYPEIKGIFLRYEVDAPIILRRYDAVLEKGEELELELKKYLNNE